MGDRTTRRSSSRRRHFILALAGFALFLLPLSAHTPTTTRFEFTKDIRPILAERCGSCHGADVASPMSLTDHASARPWVVSIKEQLLEQTMPPWFVERSAWTLIGDRQLAARELDTILDYVSGGAPKPAAPKAGGIVKEPVGKDTTAPTVELPIPDITVAAGRDRASGQTRLIWTQEATMVIAWSVSTEQRSSLRSLDLRIGVVDVGTWTAGEEWIRFPEGTGIDLTTDGEIFASWSYDKPWHHEKDRLVDRPKLRFVTRERTGEKELHSIRSDIGRLEMPRGAELVAIRPVGETENALRIMDGKSAVLELSRVDPSWPITYRLAKPAPVDELAWSGVESLTVLYAAP